MKKQGVFTLDAPSSFARWAERKRERAARSAVDLVVEVEDISALTGPERTALRDRIEACGMAVYAEPPRTGTDAKTRLKILAASFGLASLDANQLADDDGITPLSVHRDGVRARYIPYTERPITWHTDGYYNTPERTVRALLLACIQPAVDGGANQLLDAEILYLLLRERDPELIRVLMAEDALTIPGNDEEGMVRPATVGPVFSVDAGGNLHTRYTARTRNAVWSEAAAPAAQIIRAILEGDCPYILSHVLQAGQGLVSNNPLHTRQPFRDDPARPRLLYRARYHQRIEV